MQCYDPECACPRCDGTDSELLPQDVVDAQLAEVIADEYDYWIPLDREAIWHHLDYLMALARILHPRPNVTY